MWKKLRRGLNRRRTIHIGKTKIIIGAVVGFLLWPHSAPVIYADPIAHYQTVDIAKTMPVSVLQPQQGVSEWLISNPYTWGNCTWFVASNVVVPGNLGNANMWAINAAAQGFTVSTVPKVGAVAQSATDSSLGHVALVVAVNGDQVEVQEMNVAGLDVEDTAWYSASYFQYIYF